MIIKSANSPRPGIWALERSNDNGKTFLPWHYFASSPSECRSYFGVDPYLPIQDDDTVLCSTEYSQIPPFTDGEVSFLLHINRYIYISVRDFDLDFDEKTRQDKQTKNLF